MRFGEAPVGLLRIAPLAVDPREQRPSSRVKCLVGEIDRIDDGGEAVESDSHDLAGSVKSAAGFEAEFGLARDDFVDVVRLVLLDERYRDVVLRVARLPGPARGRVLRALRELIPMPPSASEDTERDR